MTRSRRKSDHSPARLPERPWRVPVALSEVPDDGRHIDLVADRQVRAAVAELAALAALPRLEAGFDLTLHGRNGLHVVGRVSATVGQICVVTLEPVPQEIDTEFRRLFAHEAEEPGDELEIDPLADLPEPLEGSLLDVGELVTEELALALDPYPRAAGVPEVAVGDDEDGPSGPFAALARLRPS